MNPITIRKPQDRQKIYNEYIASLAAQTQLLDRTAQAVSVLKQTGQPPQQPTDMRTMTQKALDIDGQKITVRKLLYSITDGQQISNIMDELSDGEVTFLSWSYQDIFNQLKAKYATGVPGPIFIEYLRRYMADYSKNLGVKAGLQNAKSDELMLSIREIIQLLPNQQTIDELIHTIQSIPADLANTQLKQQALQAVVDLKAAVPGPVLVEKSAALDPVDLSKATTLMNGGFENAPSSQQTMKMASTVIRAISSHSQGQVDDVLTSLLNTFKMERDDFIKIEQGRATIMNEKAAFDTIQPERASAIESKALQNAPRKIRSDRIPSAEQFQDFAYIESPEINMEQINDEFSATELRKWAALKINSGEIFIKGGASKMSKNEILKLVNDYKTHGLEFSKEAIDNFAPEAKELQNESATKVQLAFREKNKEKQTKK